MLVLDVAVVDGLDGGGGGGTDGGIPTGNWAVGGGGTLKKLTRPFRGYKRQKQG